MDGRSTKGIWRPILTYLILESHKKFETEHGLPFLLLSDPEKKVLQEYDVWKERSMFGKPVMGIEIYLSYR